MCRGSILKRRRRNGPRRRLSAFDRLLLYLAPRRAVSGGSTQPFRSARHRRLLRRGPRTVRRLLHDVRRPARAAAYRIGLRFSIKDKPIMKSRHSLDTWLLL